MILLFAIAYKSILVIDLLASPNYWSVVVLVHQGSDSLNRHARTDPQLSQILVCEGSAFIIPKFKKKQKKTVIHLHYPNEPFE